MEPQNFRPTVLLVDDEPINIKVMLNALKNDYTTLVATDGAKALSIVHSNNPPDLILLDIMMPEMDGYEVCERIKRDKQYANIPVIFVTAKATEEEEIKGLELGAVDYLTKPICLPILKAKVKIHIELKRHRDFVELLLDKQYQDLESQDSRHEQDRMAQQASIQRYIEEIQENQQRLKLSLWGSGDEFWSWNLQTGAFSRENPLPLPLSRIRHSIDALESVVHPEDFAELKQRFSDHLADKTDHFEASYRVKDNNDLWQWLLDRGKIVEHDQHGKPQRLSGTLKNISHLKQTEQDLLLAAKSFESISDAVWVCDEQLRVLKVNDAFTDITGYAAGEVLGQPLIQPLDKSNTLALSPEVLAIASTGCGWQGEVWGVKKDGTQFPQELQVSVLKDHQGGVSHYIGAFSDITYRKNAEEKLRYMANYDSLTGLPNRTLFMDRIIHGIETAKRNKHQMAILFLDLDNFKTVNDTLGHAAGDILLREVSNRLAECIRDCDTVARLGGDEFTLLLEKINDPSEITLVTDRILASVARPINLAGHEVGVSASIGIVIYPDHGSDYKDLMRFADIAMYHAKNNGKNMAQQYTVEMNKNTLFRMELEQQLHQMIDNDELLLHYQPKVSLVTGEIQGMEVLARWVHPKHGVIAPDIFIPLAEESGHIVRIGEEIIRKACAEAKPWWDKGLVTGRLAINLSAIQFLHGHLVERIVSIIEENGFPAECLEFEITESMVMGNQQLAIAQMDKLRQLGIHLSIDDFGTGYSSLSYLKGFPVNSLKIDRSFVKDIEACNKDKGIVASIISLAHHLNLKVIAEGVETVEQQQLLKELRCQEMQGYLFSKPLPGLALEQLLINHGNYDTAPV
ncbi:MAG: EAL domain-containing protein [Motiliproteus sp.]